MSQVSFDRIRVIETDPCITEPYDVWGIGDQPSGAPADPLANHPREDAETALGRLPESTLQKPLHDSPAALYGIG